MGGGANRSYYSSLQSLNHDQKYLPAKLEERMRQSMKYYQIIPTSQIREINGEINKPRPITLVSQVGHTNALMGKSINHDKKYTHQPHSKNELGGKRESTKICALQTDTILSCCNSHRSTGGRVNSMIRSVKARTGGESYIFSVPTPF